MRVKPGTDSGIQSLRITLDVLFGILYVINQFLQLTDSSSLIFFRSAICQHLYIDVRYIMYLTFLARDRDHDDEPHLSLPFSYQKKSRHPQ
jgi:hypothetical protein